MSKVTYTDSRPIILTLGTAIVFGGLLLIFKNPQIGVLIDWIRAGNHFNEGVVLALQRKHEDAIRAYDQAIAINPEFARAYYKRGRAHYVLNNYQEALKNLDKALDLEPRYDNDSEFYSYRGQINYYLNQYEAALQDCSYSAQLDRLRDTSYNCLGNSLSQLDKYKEAIENYTKAININDQNHWYYANRGNSFYRLAEYQKAVEDYTSAINLNPDNTDHFRKRGDSYFYLGNYQKAISDYTKFLHENNENLSVYNQRGIAYSNLGDYRAAIENFNHVLDQSSFSGIGITFEYSEKDKVFKITNVIEESPASKMRLRKDDQIQFVDSKVISDMDISDVAELIKGEADSQVVLTILRQDKREDVTVTRKKVINPEFAQTYYDRGKAHYELGDTKAALKDLELALELFLKAGEIEKRQEVEQTIESIR